jgi:bis(5'-nucleosidyl)-tetraphosphatase
VLVFTSLTAEKREFLLMKHAPRYDLPKGHMERYLSCLPYCYLPSLTCCSGETEIQTALRELREETGLTAEQVKIDPTFMWTDTYYPKYR